MTDTLKRANQGRPAGSQAQAKTVADAWTDQAREDLPPRPDVAEIDTRSRASMTSSRNKLDSSIARLEGKLDKLTWMVGFALAGILAIIARLLLLGP